MNGIVLAGALAVVPVLAVLVWLLRRGRGGRIESPEEAAEAADRALPGFATAGAVVGADGAGALAVSENGRIAAMKRDGGAIAVREVVWTSVRSTPEGIVVETGERRFGRVALVGVDALDIRRLAPQLTRL